MASVTPGLYGLIANFYAESDGRRLRLHCATNTAPISNMHEARLPGL